MAARAKNKTFLAKQFAHAMSVHYRDFEHAYDSEPCSVCTQSLDFFPVSVLVQ